MNKDRIRNFGEVFTPVKVVKKMCNLIPIETWQDITKTFLEPACGNGNFLVEILTRKLKYCKNDNDKIIALQSIYGIDILQDNIEASKKRLKKKLKNIIGVDALYIDEILNKNIQVGDSLKGKDKNGDDLIFINWQKRQENGDFETFTLLEDENNVVELQLFETKITETTKVLTTTVKETGAEEIEMVDKNIELSLF